MMKAFSPDIFTEQAQASLKEEAYKLVSQDKKTISTILEMEEYISEAELEYKRNMYKTLLEDQKLDLGVYHEGAITIAILAAIFAAIVSLIKSIFKTSNQINDFSKKIKSDRDFKNKVFGNGKEDPNAAVRLVNKLIKMPCENPYINRDLQRGKIGKMSFSDFDRFCSNTTIEENFVNYTYPNSDIFSYNIASVRDLVNIGEKVKDITKSFIRDQSSLDNSAIDQIKSEIEKIRSNIRELNIDGSSSSESTNLKKYLTTKFPWLGTNGYSKSNGGWDLEYTPTSNDMSKILEISRDLVKFTTEYKDTAIQNPQAFEKVHSISAEWSAAFSELATKCNRCMINFYTIAIKEINQMNNICKTVGSMKEASETGILNIPIIHESYAIPTNNSNMIFEADEFFYDDLYTQLDETVLRFNIYKNRVTTKAVNEEALIFSETGISDYEKFQRLQAVNEALSDKIKRGWYNTVAAIKEIFRKFMEKLNANFTTTKHYLDQYKNIILKANFNPNDTYKTQDLDAGIKRIYNTEAPALNFNNFVDKEFSTVGQYFALFDTTHSSIGSKIEPPNENSSIGDISKYYKAYFCMEGNEHTYTGKEFQQHIVEFYNFLYDIRKINSTIKKSIRDIEDTANKIMKQAGVDVNKPAENTAPAQEAPDAAQPTPGAESVYSVLYQKYFTLNENGVLVEAEINNGQSTEAKAPSQTMQNVKSREDGGDDTQNIRNTERGTVDAKVKAYVDVTTAMLKAKMSACEFIRNELMQIIRNHVQAHIGNKAANPQPQQQAQAPANPPAK